MSDQEKFLARWSRRKRTAEQEAEPNRTSTAGSPECADQPDTAAKPETLAAEPGASFDASTLPPIESIDAASDIRPFLARGVPAEMTRAALRRAWAADPVIRDFVGLSENAWDFNATVAVHGFGALGPTEIAELAKRYLLDQHPSVMPPPQHAEVGAPPSWPQIKHASDSPTDRRSPAAVEEAPVPHIEVTAEESLLRCDKIGTRGLKKAADIEKVEQLGPRRHGRALPE